MVDSLRPAIYNEQHEKNISWLFVGYNTGSRRVWCKDRFGAPKFCIPPQLSCVLTAIAGVATTQRQRSAATCRV